MYRCDLRPRRDAGGPHRHAAPILPAPGAAAAALQAGVQSLHRAQHGDLQVAHSNADNEHTCLNAPVCCHSSTSCFVTNGVDVHLAASNTAYPAAATRRSWASGWRLAIQAYSGRRCCGPWACRRTSMSLHGAYRLRGAIGMRDVAPRLPCAAHCPCVFKAIVMQLECLLIS